MEKVSARGREASTSTRWLAWALSATALVLSAAGITMGVLTPAPVAQTSGLPTVLALGLASVAVSYAVSGAVLASRRPDNAIGWLMIAIGLSEAVLVVSSGYAFLALAHPSMSFGAVCAWMGSWTYLPPLGMILTFLLLLYPTGHPPTPRWRWVAWVAGVGLTVATVGSAIALWDSRVEIFAHPNADVSPSGAVGAIAGVGMLLTFGVAGLASIASLAVRWRHSRGDERQQLRWFLLAVAVAVVGFVVTGIDTRYIVLSIGMLLIPASIAVAVLKYHLYDLDIVVRKAVVFLVIAGGLTVLSLGALLVLPTLAIGALSGTERLLIVLGVVIGLASVPLSRWGRRVANRVVYGRRATPYEVLSTFSSQVGTTFADDDVTIRMAGLLREATGALSATVWLNVDGTLHAVATSPDGSTAAVWPDEGVEVHYQGERLGGLSVEMPANDPLDATRGRLIRDLAGQAGPVLANVRLVEELRASRRRIVAAQDERAKKLERNIHDGAQQQLVALAVQLKLAEGMVGKDAEKQRELLARLGVQASEALEDLRDLARGIYPPLLQDKGLAAALEAQARKAVVPTTVHADGIGRFSEDVESAVYFSVLEALQNVAKYAEATSAEIALANSNGSLRFTVTDDGRGFDTGSTGYGTGLQGIADRLAAIGGEFAVTSSPGQGTTISGVVPA